MDTGAWLVSTGGITLLSGEHLLNIFEGGIAFLFRGTFDKCRPGSTNNFLYKRDHLPLRKHLLWEHHRLLEQTLTKHCFNFAKLSKCSNYVASWVEFLG